MHTRHNIKLRLSDCSKKPVVQVVPHLAHTAAEVSQMAAKGIPVSSSNAENQYFDGYLPRQVPFESEFSRGYDINIAWEEQCASRENVSNGKKAARLRKQYDDYLNGRTDKNPIV